MLYKYTKMLLSEIDKVELSNMTIFEMCQYLKDRIQQLSNDELEAMSEYYNRSMSDDSPEIWTDSPYSA